MFAKLVRLCLPPERCGRLRSGAVGCRCLFIMQFDAAKFHVESFERLTESCMLSSVLLGDWRHSALEKSVSGVLIVENSAQVF